MRALRPYLSVLALCLSCVSTHAGYTHYFTWHQKPSAADLKGCIDEMRLIIEARKSILTGPDGPSSPIIESLHIDLNGVGEDEHEPFVFPGEVGFNFCKTDGKPYDAVVTACLLVAHDHFPPAVLSISSDGSWSRGDWQDGAKLYSSILNRQAQSPMSESWIGDSSRYIPWLLIAAVLALVAIFRWFRKKPGKF